MKILYTGNFLKMLRHLPLNIQNKADQKEIIFRKYPFSQTLKTHKLKGKFKSCYSFSVDYDCRIVFKFSGKDTVVFMLIGNHSIYQ
jgi:mRNA-degrading endonuclease YafQ of YafQ-DinJ toxin-antitoxin module